jgi:hypothetical protein
MRAAHQSFKVGPGEFSTFNDVLIGVATAAGVSAADTTAVRNVLESTRGDICNTPACTGGSSTSGGTSGPIQPTTTFVLNVQPKSSHPWTDGNTVGYKIDGVEGGGVTLTAGRLYGFQNMAPCAHPVYISTSDQGAGSAEVPDGLSYPGGNPFGGCNGATVFFTPTTAQIGTALYYQCQVHLRMGGPLTIVGPGGTATSSSSTSGGVSGTSTTGEEVPGSGAFAAPAFILLAMCLFFML